MAPVLRRPLGVTETTYPAMASPRPAARDLDRSLVQGLAWTGVVRWSTQILSWAATLVVARLLSPNDYGLMGMAMVYVGLLQLVNEFGLTTPIVQQRDATLEQLSRLGGLAVIAGLALAGVSLALAGRVAGFFGEPAVEGIIAVLSGTFIARGIAVLPKGLLARELRFPRLAAVDAVEALTLTGVTLTLAILGAGYWALVLGSLSAAVASACAAGVARGCAHRLPVRFGSLLRSIRVGWQVSVSQVAWYTYANADFAIVGRILGKTALGAYSLGWYVASVPVDRVSVLLARVAPPVFARTQDDARAVGRYLTALTEGLALLTFPAAIGIVLVADELVLGLLGAQWAPAILPLRLLALYAGFRSVMTLPPHLLTMTGHARATMWYSVVAALILPTCFLVGTRWGTTGVAVAWIIGYPLVSVPTFLRHALRVTGLTVRDYLHAVWPALRATTVMAALVTTVRVLTPGALSPTLGLVLHVGVGIAGYAAVVYYGHRDRLRAVYHLVRGTRT